MGTGARRVVILAVVVAASLWGPPTEAATGTWADTAIGRTGWTWSDALVRAGGTTHVAHYDTPTGAVRYTTCAAACHVASSWASVEVAGVGGNVRDVALARDGAGRLHLAWADGPTLSSFTLGYATCATACTSAGSWQVLALEPLGDHAAISMAVSSGGVVHVAGTRRVASTAVDLFHSRCASGCGVLSSWSTTSLLDGDATVANPASPSLALDVLDRPRLAFTANAQGTWNTTLFFARCDGGCTATAGWQRAPVAPELSVPLAVSLAMDGTAAHMAVHHQDIAPLPVRPVGPAVSRGIGSLSYLACAGGCTAAANWSPAVVVNATAGVIGPDLVVEDGRVRVAFWSCRDCNIEPHQPEAWLAACDSGCTGRRGWGSEHLDVLGAASGLSLVDDGDGLALAYTRNGPVRVATCTSSCTPPPDAVPVT